MTDEKEIALLIRRVEDKGGVVTVTYDENLLASEGRTVISTVQVQGMKGIGPYPMAPIAAAEAMRRVVRK